MQSRGHCARVLVHVFYTCTYTLCMIMVTHKLNRAFIKLCVDISANLKSYILYEPKSILFNTEILSPATDIIGCIVGDIPCMNQPTVYMTGDTQVSLEYYESPAAGQIYLKRCQKKGSTTIVQYVE